MVFFDDVTCAGCGTTVSKPRGEIVRSRKLGRRLFCSRTCSAKTSNAPRKRKQIVLVCPNCDKEFETTTHNKAARHCSRSCASEISYVSSPRRIEAARQSGLDHADNLWRPVAILKLREAWKYVELEPYLDGRPHEFEFELGEFVFDLALFDVGLLVEFDGPEHSEPYQLAIDRRKDESAGLLGWKTVRKKVRRAEVVPVTTIKGL